MWYRDNYNYFKEHNEKFMLFSHQEYLLQNLAIH